MVVILNVLFTLSAQKIDIKYYGIPSGIKTGIKKVDSSAVDIAANKVLQALRKEGYWLGGVDSIEYEAGAAKIHIHKGRRFDGLNIELNDTEAFFRKKLTNSGQNFNLISDRIQEILQQYENAGYPFANVDIDEATWKGDSLYISLKVNPNLLITYDSLFISPESILSKKFVARYLNLNYGEVYNESDILEIKRRLENFHFLKLVDASVAFRLKKAEVSLQIEKQNTSYFDGILGMIPDQERGTGVVFTGELKLGIQNLFQSAKSLEIHWQRLQPESQMLDAKYRHPLFLGSPLNLSLVFYQIRQDTAFSNRKLQAGFDYYISPKLNMSFKYQNKLGNDLESLDSNTADLQINMYGLGLTYRDFDDNLNPKKGVTFSTDFSLGTKRVTSDELIPASTQYDLTMDAQWLQSVSARSVLALIGQGGYLINEALYLNDLYRLGGMRSIRGFNEGEFFASSYAVLTAEARFYLDQDSYLLSFFDQGFLAENTISRNFYDRPSALGIGIRMSTKNGNFLVLYGLGKRFDQNYSFDSSKIHFGYTALF